MGIVGTLRRQGVLVLLGLLAAFALPQLASAAGSTLEQCSNGTNGTTACLGSQWQNGNLNQSNSLYREGDFVPFRSQITGLTAGQSITLVMAYDVVEHDNHAYDYLGSWNGTETGDPCDGATCPAGVDTFPIPLDPNTDYPNPLSTQVPGVMTIWGGDITAMVYVTTDPVDVDSTGTIERRISVTFTPTGSTVLLAWGGHIASQIDWGAGETAISDTQGSPYHMRLIEFRIGDEVESIGNQDRSLKGAAVAPVPPNFETEASAASIPLGASVTDSAFLSGPSGAVTGTVNFFVCSDTTPPFTNPDCSTLGTAAGSGTIASGEARSPMFTPGAIGNYCFRAEYHPDAFAPYSPGTHTNTVTASVPFGQSPFGECFEVIQPTGTIKVVKDFIGTATSVGLQVDGTTRATVTADGETAAITVNAGAGHTAGEVFTGGNSDNYTTTFACTRNGTQFLTGSTLTTPGFTVNNGDVIVCTFTNTRKASSILVTKSANPTSMPEPGGPVQFTVVVKNTSAADNVTLTAASFVDAVEGGAATAIGDIDCNGGAAGNGLPTTLAPNAELTCTFTKTVSGDEGDVIDDVVTVTGTNEDGEAVSDSDDASVTLTDVLPTITVVKTAVPTSLPEPGGNVTYNVTVTNTAAEAVTLTSLVDDKFGNLDGRGSCDVPQTLAANGGSYTCSFTGAVSGNAGATHVNVVTATATDDDENTATDTDDATVTLTDVPSSLLVEKTASPTSVQAPGGNVTFTVVVKNTSAVDSVTLTAAGFTDKVGSGPTEVISNIDCNGATAGSGLPLVLAPNNGAAGGPDEVTCTFVKAVSGSGGTSVTDLVTVTGTDDDGNPTKDDDDATVTITTPPSSPPPPPPVQQIDLTVTKSDSPDPTVANSNITYVMIVSNKGPGAATDVRLADPLPADTTFVSVETNQGTCTGGALTQCSLGTILVGQRVQVTLVVTATRAGTVTNTVTVVGREPEANQADNTATATTLVQPPPTAPLTPPRPATPAPAPVVCYTFTVSAKSLTVGQARTLVVTVKARGKAVKGASVVVRGAGILKSARTNAQGRATIQVTPRRAGIVTVTVPQKIVCGARRIGVVGAFEPPVTG